MLIKESREIFFLENVDPCAFVLLDFSFLPWRPAFKAPISVKFRVLCVKRMKLRAYFTVASATF